MKQTWFKRCLRGALPISLSALLAVAPVEAVLAESALEVYAGTETEETITKVSLSFVDEDGNVIGTPYTPEELKSFAGQSLREASLAHESYYDKASNKTYDIVDDGQLDQLLGEDTTVTYRLRADNEDDPEAVKMAKIHTVYYTRNAAGETTRHEVGEAFELEKPKKDFDFTEFKAKAKEQAPKTLEVKGSASEGTCDVTFHQTESLLKGETDGDYDLVYDPEIQYTVTIDYIDAATQKSMGKRTRTVDNKNLRFTVPKTFTRETANEDNTKNIIKYQVKDDLSEIYHEYNQSQLEYKVEYEAADDNAPYEWLVYLIDTKNNRQLDARAIEVKPGETQTFDAAAAAPSGYNLNASMQKTYTHTFGDDSRATYVFYDPEGFTDRQDPYNVTVQYIALSSDGNGTITQTPLTEAIPYEILPGDDTVIPVPQIYAKDGTTYRLMNGQARNIVHPYYTTARNAAYEVYYVAEGSELEPAVVVRQVVRQTTTVEDGQTVTRYIPGVTTTVVEEAPGITNPTVIRTEDAGGGTTGTTAGNNNNAATPAGGTTGTDNQNNQNNPGNVTTPNEQVGPGEDAVIDNAEIDEIQTPLGNVDLDNESDHNSEGTAVKSSKMATVGIGIGAALILAAAAIAVYSIRRKKR